MEWTPVPKPAEIAETRLIDAILSNTYPIDSNLPPERDLATLIGVTRPTLREALQRLARDGWVEIHHGRPTRVRNYWKEGNLAVLGAIARRPTCLPGDFVSNLLVVRQVIAPAYTRLAVENDSQHVLYALAITHQLDNQPASYAAADLEVHHHLTLASNNPIFVLILNGFRDLYPPMGALYFASPEARQHSRHFYTQLEAAAQHQDPDQAETITRQVMMESVELWRKRGGYA